MKIALLLLGFLAALTVGPWVLRQLEVRLVMVMLALHRHEQTAKLPGVSPAQRAVSVVVLGAGVVGALISGFVTVAVFSSSAPWWAILPALFVCISIGLIAFAFWMRQPMQVVFHRARYLDEMRSLIRSAVERWHRESRPERILTVSIWTDPDARCSSISIDTRVNSDRAVEAINEFNRRERRRLLEVGDTELAALFKDEAVRNCNPADFAFRDYGEVENQSFPKLWAEKSSGACWNELGPALSEIRAWAVTVFAELPLEPDAELSTNSEADWYDDTTPLRAV